MPSAAVAGVEPARDTLTYMLNRKRRGEGEGRTKVVELIVHCPAKMHIRQVQLCARLACFVLHAEIHDRQAMVMMHSRADMSWCSPWFPTSSSGSNHAP